jgi:hypothetical protein
MAVRINQEKAGLWIRIRIRNADPGGQKLPTKKEKKVNNFHV